MSNDMDNFVGLSAVLTGFSQEVLAPDLDPVDIKSEYLPVFTANVTKESGDPSLVAGIFQKYAMLQSQTLTPQQIGEAMLDPANGEAFVLACRKLIFMWYAGAWPTIAPASATAQASTVSDLISAKAYTASLVWQVMQSHPMGDSNYRYGYWNKPPVPLSDYTGQ
ncbi:hypothetical protein [Luteibacter sp. CQ10]|uniref:hypothetical protein n=1 Tax=Luteibacter sp. CQ10 TaxID=2805821 RepID=UPI0034A4FA1E